MPPPFVTAASAWVDARIASATRLPIAASRVRTVAVRLSSATAVVPSASSSSLPSSPSYFATTAATSGSGFTVAVSMMRNCGHQVHAAAAVLLLDVDGDVDCGDIVGVVARFRHGVAAVEFDEEIVIVTAEHEIDRACLENRVVLTAAGMDHRHDEISPFTSQRLGCILRGGDRRQEFQIFGARRAR